jgi:hypothetical protein
MAVGMPDDDPLFLPRPLIATEPRRANHHVDPKAANSCDREFGTRKAKEAI